MPAPVAPAESPARTTDGQPQSAIVFEQVSISFEGNMVLDGISFSLERGETKALLGVAGSGKSTILKLTMGLVKPDHGNIWVLGQEVSAMKEEDLFELRRKLGMVFQESALFDSLTVRDNVAYRLIEEGVPEDKIQKRVKRLCALWNWNTRSTCIPVSSPGACGGGWRLPAPLWTSPKSCSMTRPPGGSTR